MTDLLLGIDIGTTNIKAVLATPEGWIIAQAQTDYPIHHPKPGWAEQNPADWWQGTIEVTRDVLANAQTQSRVLPIEDEDAARFHFAAGFTSKMPGTEKGVTEPEPTFSSFFGQPFMPPPAM